MTRITAGFIAQDLDGIAVYGLGPTSEAALEDALREAGPQYDRSGEPLDHAGSLAKFKTFPASPELMEKVGAEGGAIPVQVWDGVATVGGHVFNAAGKSVDFEDCAEQMEDEIRERLHLHCAPCSEQDFMTAYEAAHLEAFGTPFNPWNDPGLMQGADGPEATSDLEF